MSGRKALVFCDGEDTEKALSGSEIVVSDGGVVLLTGGVQDVDLDLVVVQH